MLLENGARVNSQNTPGATPLFLATEGLHKNLSNVCTTYVCMWFISACVVLRPGAYRITGFFRGNYISRISL